MIRPEGQSDQNVSVSSNVLSLMMMIFIGGLVLVLNVILTGLLMLIKSSPAA